MRQAADKLLLVNHSHLSPRNIDDTPVASPMQDGCCRRRRRRSSRVNGTVASRMLKALPLLAILCLAKVMAEETHSRFDFSAVMQLRQKANKIFTSLSLKGPTAVSGRVEARFLQGGSNINSCWFHICLQTQSWHQEICVVVWLPIKKDSDAGSMGTTPWTVQNFKSVSYLVMESYSQNTHHSPKVSSACTSFSANHKMPPAVFIQNVRALKEIVAHQMMAFFSIAAQP